MIGIYKITNLVNGKCYIGQSCNISRRKREHKFISSEHNRYLKIAYKKYGRENFSFETLEECKEENLDEKEIYWISKLKPEYNITSGGKGQKDLKHTLETRKKLKEKGKEFWNNLDKEIQQKIINNNLKRPEIGHKVSQETREKLRQCNLGKKQSQETIEKRKQTMINKRKNGWKRDTTNNCKKVICLETNEIFNSVKEASEKYNLSTLVGHLKGRYSSSKGLHFKYYQNDCSVTTNDDECNRVE